MKLKRLAALVLAVMMTLAAASATGLSKLAAEGTQKPEKSVVDAARNPPRVVYPTITRALMIIAVRYFTPKRLEKSFPQAANPEAVYGIKKITIKIAPIDCNRCLLSLKRLLKNDGNVIELPATCV